MVRKIGGNQEELSKTDQNPPKSPFRKGGLLLVLACIIPPFFKGGQGGIFLLFSEYSFAHS